MKSHSDIYLSSMPDLLSEWDYEKNSSALLPEKITIGSNKRVWWKCSKGHSWKEPVVKRTHGKPCPYCTNRRVWVGYNDLKTRYPLLAAEWNYEENKDVDIDSVVLGSNRKVSWKCSSCGFVWTASVSSRTKKGTGCPACAQKKRVTNHQKTFLKHNGALCDKALLSAWDYDKNAPLKPENVTAHSSKAVWWKCPVCGYSWRAKISNRSNGRGCPQCSNRALVKGVNDLETCNPTLASEWDFEKNAPLLPSDVFSKSGRKYFWICPNGHSYSASALHRAAGTNCPFCNAGRQTSFAEQAVFYYIKQVFPDAVNRYKDIFDNGMEVDIFIPSAKLAIEYDGIFWHKDKNVERDRQKYHICQKNNVRLIRVRESDSTPYDLADESFHVDNLDNRKNLEQLIRYLLSRLDPRSNMWTRTQAIFYSPVSIDLVRDEQEIRQYMTVTKNSLQDVHPEIAAQWHPTKNGTLKPDKFKCGSDYKAWWLCPTCGHAWQTSIGHRVSGTGCPVCYQNNRKGHSPLAKKIYQFSKQGQFIKEWSSIAEASETLAISRSNIGTCIQGKRNSAGGYIWRDSPEFRET